MHTIKGASRTLDFKHLTPSIHEAENQYQSILRNGSEINYSQLRLDLDAVRASFNQYREINCKKLGRSDDFTKVSLSREFLENHITILEGLVEEPILTSDVIAIISSNKTALLQATLDYLDTIVEDYKNRARKIARDLGRSEPVFHIDLDQIALRSAQRIALDNAMVHIIRNILDHGIEPADVRKSKGKPESGIISIVGRKNDSDLVLIIQDDGQGLNIERIKNRGLEIGKFRGNESAVDIADSIFEVGISSAERVTAMSGRGVGMRAVREFLRGAGGDVRLVLGDMTPGCPGIYSFKLIITLPIAKKQAIELAS